MAGLLPKSNVATGQSFDGLAIQSSIFGLPVPLVYGTTRLPGNLIDYIDFTQHNQSQSSGGKGGGVNTTTTTYTVAVAIGLAQGPVKGFGRVWGGKATTQLLELNWAPDAATQNVINAMMYDSNDNALSQDTVFTPFFGGNTQAPWAYMLTNHPERALNYPLLAYAAGVPDLGDSDSLASYSFELFSNFIFGNGILDANPAACLYDMLTNPIGGANYPAAYLGDMTNFSNYCIASGIFLSPTITTQKQAADIINDMMQCTNSQPVVSQGILSFISNGITAVSGNGATYTPNLTPEYILTDDDFIHQDNTDPVQLVRNVSLTDSYNFQQLSFDNRADEYNSDIVSAIDQGGVDRLNGVRPASTASLEDYIKDATVAQTVVQNILQRVAYFKNQYTFKLPYYPFICLDPMDLLDINDNNLGLVNKLVRIISAEPDENREITFVVEEIGAVSTGAVIYPRQSATRGAINYGIVAGNINPPVIFEPPDALGDGLEIWIGASGGTNWGGCDVWISEDGNTFKRFGRITQPARQGILSTALAPGVDPDITDTLGVNLAMSNAQISSGTQADADNYNTLCYVDNELISYKTATLTGTDQYNLTYLRRGAYGTTITAHNANSQFMRIDQDVLFSYSFSQADIGKTIYLKFTSFNVFGAGEQDLANVQPYQYTIQGSALNSPLANVQNLKIVYQNNNAVLQWDPVSDFRSPILYEIRKGASWGQAQVLGRINGTSYVLPGNDTYWIAAVYQNIYNGNTYTAYSANPEEIIVSAASVPTNIVAAYDEASTGWKGTVYGGVLVESGILTLVGTGDFAAIPDVGQVTTLEFYGGVASAGAYVIPSSHIIQLVSAQIANISCGYSLQVVPALQKFSQITDVDQMAGFAGNNPQNGNAQIQINVMNSAGTWQGWQNFVPGQYYGKAFNFQILLTSSNPQYTVLISDFSVSANVQDNPQSGNITIPASGSSVIYPQYYNMVPNPVISIFNAQAGDTVVLSNQTANGFTVQITNNGVGVSRTINWVATGY